MEVEELFSDTNYSSLYRGRGDWLDILIQAQDGYQISVYNTTRDVTIPGTFQRNANTGSIEILNSEGFAAPEIAYMLSGTVSSFTDASGYDPIWGKPVPIQYYHLPSGCNLWDCVALAGDAAGIGLNLGRDTSLLSIPVTGPLGAAGATSGQVASNAITYGAYLRTLYLYSQGNASKADVAVNTLTAGANLYPGVAEAAGVVQFLWDFFDPLIWDD